MRYGSRKVKSISQFKYLHCMCDILASGKCYKRYDFICFLELKTDELSEICDGSLFPVLGALPGHMTDGCDSSERESVYSIQVSFCPKTIWFVRMSVKVQHITVFTLHLQQKPRS